MQQKPADKLKSVQDHELCLVAILPVFPFKSNFSVDDAFDAAVRDGHPVGVPAQVFYDGLRALKGFLTKHNPLQGIELVQQSIEIAVLPERFVNVK